MKNKPLYHTIADKLARQIDKGKFPPGSRLPAERELAEQFGVSRVTIREAEIALQALGRISIKTGSGVYVADSVVDREQDFPPVTAFELTEARALFESEAAALAAEQMSDETIAELERLVDILSSTSGDDAAGEKADHDFHFAIAAASNNAAIIFLIETMWKMRDEIESVKAVHESICSEDIGARGHEHGKILDAMRARDPKAARVAMREHFRRLLESMLDVTHDQAMEELRKRSTESRNRYLKSANL
ncbi:MAG: FadR family transcriptional regulator [Woeseiaceae bacterium]|nr:FadR family transcriptional regulator [Woeseiaceae bacterium]